MSSKRNRLFYFIVLVVVALGAVSYFATREKEQNGLIPQYTVAEHRVNDKPEQIQVLRRLVLSSKDETEARIRALISSDVKVIDEKEYTFKHIPTDVQVFVYDKGWTNRDSDNWLAMYERRNGQERGIVFRK